jgi:lysophospholipase L1-like esterase
VLDLWTELQTQPDWNSHLSDGLHLSAAGNEAVYVLLIQLIRDQLPGLR